jgi:porin
MVFVSGWDGYWRLMNDHGLFGNHTMGNAPTSPWGRLLLAALCLAGIGALGGAAQSAAPSANPGGADQGGGANAPGFATKPAAGDAAAKVAGENSTGSTPAPPPPFGGPWGTRPKLTGDWFGVRDHLCDNGITVDASATTYSQGTARGGLVETFRFGGRGDYLVNVDGEKAGLWSGFAVNVHAETVYGDSVNSRTGALVPVNIGRSLPFVEGQRTALTNVKFSQALSDNLLAYAGKINTVDNPQQPFMRYRGLDAGFMNGAFVFNPVLGRTIPYSTFGGGAAVLANGYPVLTLTVYGTHDASHTSVFDHLFENGALVYPTASVQT